MAAYPKDRFDELPEDLRRVGAHRGPRRKGRGWIAFAWAFLATGVLIFAGLFALSEIVGINVGLPIFQTSATPVPSATPTPTASPVLDPKTIDPARAIRTTVLNGTATPGLENTVGDALAALGWTIDGRAVAAQKDIKTTTVYYSDKANEDVARGLVLALGKGQIKLVTADTFPGAPINIVIGLDYPGATTAG